MIRVIAKEIASACFVAHTTRTDEVEITFCSDTCVFRELPETVTVVVPGTAREDVVALYDDRIWLNAGRMARSLRRTGAGRRPSERSALLRRIQAARLPGVTEVMRACTCGYVLPQYVGQSMVDHATRPVWHRLVYPAAPEPIVDDDQWSEAARIVAGAAKGLSALHELAIGHQAPYPQNLIVTPDDTIRWVGLSDVVELDDHAQALDVLGFAVYCLGPWLLRLRQLPGHTSDDLGAILGGLPLPEVLPGLAEWFDQQGTVQQEWVAADPNDLWAGLQNLLKRRDVLGEVARTWAWAVVPQRVADFVAGDWDDVDPRFWLHNGPSLAGRDAGRGRGSEGPTAGGLLRLQSYSRRARADAVLRDLRRNLEQATAREHAIRTEINRIHQSIGWRFILKIYAFQRSFTPPGSLRLQIMLSLARLIGLGEPAPMTGSGSRSPQLAARDASGATEVDELTERMEALRERIRRRRQALDDRLAGPQP